MSSCPCCPPWVSLQKRDAVLSRGGRQKRPQCLGRASFSLAYCAPLAPIGPLSSAPNRQSQHAQSRRFTKLSEQRPARAAQMREFSPSEAVCLFLARSGRERPPGGCQLLTQSGHPVVAPNGPQALGLVITEGNSCRKLRGPGRTGVGRSDELKDARPRARASGRNVGGHSVQVAR